MTILIGSWIALLTSAKMQTYFNRLFSRLCLFGLFGMALILLSSCRLLPASEQEAAATGTGNHLLPVGWEAIGDWQDINLDDDAENEHLLLFRFDSGQIGALILEGDIATSISPPDYLLPRYFDDQGGLGQGVIAAPGTLASAITLVTVNGNSPARELVMLADNTHLTFAWWKGTGNGYGVAQLYASGGFGVDWTTWLKDPAALGSVMGYERLADYRARANICKMVLYTRRTDLPSPLPSIIYRAQPQGLHFCGSVIPAYPYAPEGVVLAYLRGPRPGDAALEQLLTPGTALAQLDAESAFERLSIERIEDIAAYSSVPMRQVQGTPLTPTTTVCVEFVETGNPTLRRWVVYTLRYQPVDAVQQLPNRWTLSGARTEPPPLEAPPAGYCNTILNRNAP